MGLSHGLYCLGCCWILMALLFAGGVMNLLGVAVLAAVVLIEKLFPARLLDGADRRFVAGRLWHRAAAMS